MTIIKQIKAEIEKQIKDPQEHCYGVSSINKLREILDFINTIELENPINQDKDLNSEIKRFVAEYDYERSEDILLIAIVARHFYDLGCRRTAEKYDEIEYNRQREEEDTSKDLEEAAEKHLDTMFGRGKHQPFYKDLFIAGAKWQKEQMMKEAVKGTVYGNGGYTWVVGNIPPQFKYGDKVKIIFVKED